MIDKPIRITVAGCVAETIGMAAARVGMDPGALTSALRRAGVGVAGRLDGRTPLYLADDIDRMIGGRPRAGRGSSGASS